jgi:nucleoside-diphosphate-sugar epimerase
MPGMSEGWVLVTGGAGFIGSHLVDALLAQGRRVRVLDNLSSGHRALVAPAAEFVDGDVRDLDTCRTACAGVDTVWHLAAIGSVPLSIDDPLTAHAVNATGTLQMLEASRGAGVRRFIFASSSAVYGANPALPRREDQLPLPLSPYAIDKLAAEGYTRQYYPLYGLETVAFRFFNVYGPRQDPHSQYAAVIPNFFSALLAGQAPEIFGDGEQSRDFIAVADVVDALVRAADCHADGVAGATFNLASGQTTSVNALLAAMQRVLDTDIAPVYLPARAGDVRYSDADISLVVDRLGFTPRVTLEEGLRATAAWYRAQMTERPA